MNTSRLRRIRSFVKREGRMTSAQNHALTELLPQYGVSDPLQAVDLEQLFQRNAPCYLEVGFGMGDSLLEIAETHPQNNYLGIEVHRPGVGRLLIALDNKQLTNLRLINHDAVEVLQHAVPENSLDGVYLFFPDPWHKKKHHKRRIVQPGFVQQVRHCLKPGGLFHLATDWQHYAEHMMDVLSTAEGFNNTAGNKNYADRGSRPETKYERRGQRLGHEVWDLVFSKEH